MERERVKDEEDLSKIKRIERKYVGQRGRERKEERWDCS